ncbi:MAG: hypothetical protein HC916_09590 [Coleofasciculaceae cyanobacterium SM2_1_6]|nr:hypothetical protein [Coleofasciculaceae cyanobacterium SM2_1_6]
MDILIESTKDFEKDIDGLKDGEKAITVNTINDCSSLFPDREVDLYRKLRRLPLGLGLNGYESSLYILEVSQKLRVILTVDHDPIFRQVVFTLFRVVNSEDIDRAYQNIAESLYQEILYCDRETAAIR